MGTMQLYWPLIDNALDKSGAGHNGTVNGAINVKPSGLRGGCYVYNAITNGIYTANFIAANPNQLTVSMWINFTTQARNQFIFQRALTSPTVGYLRLYRPTNSTNLIVGYATGSANGAITITNYFQGFNDTWVNIAVTLDTVSLNINTYRNGNLLRNHVAPAILPISTYVYTNIGNYGSTGSIIGKICEVKVDEAAWTPQRVKNEYMLNAGLLAG